MTTELSQHNVTSSSETSTNGQWSNDDKRKLAAVVSPIVDMQKSYGRQIDMKSTLRGWQAVLSRKYTVYQVIWALEQYVMERDDFPSPANIHKILNPEKPRVTEAQYVAAMKYQERNGFPRFSQEADIITEYNAQNSRDRESYSSAQKEILKLASDSVKRIGKE